MSRRCSPCAPGAARIALEAGIDSGIAGVVTVAVGLTYDAKARFRSRALVRVAEPVSISRWAKAHGTTAGTPCGGSPTTWPIS